MADRQKLIDVFMHMGDHIRSLDEYGFCFDSTLAKAIEDVLAMLKTEETVATDNNVGSKWISVSERLPENGSNVLGYSYDEDGSRIFPANYDNGWWHDCFFNIRIITVTHWMPLPEPPKEEKE